MSRPKPQLNFFLCVKKADCQDLEVRKIYQAVPDDAALSDGYLRVIDESGEDYLYPKDYFVQIELTQAAQDALLSVA